MIANEGQNNEMTLRVYLESDSSREYFDWDTLEECFTSVRRLVASAIKESAVDGEPRQVGIAIVPKLYYGNESSYGSGIDTGES